MFILANFIGAVAKVLDIVLWLMGMFIFVRAVISWFNPDPSNVLVQLLNKVTEPILAPIRKILPQSLRFGIDISPIIAFLCIFFIKEFAVRSLIDIAFKMRGF